MSKNKKPGSKSGNSADAFMADMVRKMDKFNTAESLNTNILMPFVEALESVCEARGYQMNIYGDKANIVFSNSDDAEVIYQMVEAYLEADKGDELDVDIELSQ